jgi:stage III sporulation protein AF
MRKIEHEKLTFRRRGGLIPIKDAIKSLLALILLAGFLELLLPDDEMRKYTRMVVGLIVLFSLINLVGQIGRDVALELPVSDGLSSPGAEALVAEGLNLRRQGENKATELATPVLQGEVERILHEITGIKGIKVEIAPGKTGAERTVKVTLVEDPGVPPDLVKRMVAELLKIKPEQVEVEEKIESEQ